MKMKLDLLWLEKNHDLVKPVSLITDYFSGRLLYPSGGEKPQAHSHAKYLNPTVEKSDQEQHTTEGCIIIFWISG